MESHGAIKVRLGSAHPHSNRRHLNDFSGMFSHHVTAQHLVRAGLNHQLEQSARTTLGKCLRHGSEPRPLDHNSVSTQSTDGGFFGKTDGGQLRLTEHRARHKVMIHLARSATKLSISKGSALIHRHRGEADAIGHVAHSEDMRSAGALVSIHRQLPAVAAETSCFQVQALQKRLTPGRQKHASGRDPISLIRDENKITGRAFDGRRTGG